MICALVWRAAHGEKAIDKMVIRQTYCRLTSLRVIPYGRAILLSATISCLASQTALAALPCDSSLNASGQTTCPTESCFFHVSEVFFDKQNTPTPTSTPWTAFQTMIGDTSQMINGGVSPWTGLPITSPPSSAIFGPGDYDGFNSLTNMSTLDGIAIGSDTRLRIYRTDGFGGGTYIDINGPAVLNNYGAAGYGGAFSSAASTFLAADWTGISTLFDQFPPATRSVRSDMFAWEGYDSDGGSVRVTCTASPPPAAVNGLCDNGTPLGCSLGTAISDNVQTACGTTRSWVCQGSGGGSNSGTCNYANPACPPAAVNGTCNNGTPLGCANGTPTSDNGQTACGTTRSWICQGSGGGSDSGACNYANPACPAAGCGSAAGIAVPSAPSSNLCSGGTASGVTQSGSTWQWTCTP